MKVIFILLSLLSMNALAKVEEVELSTCYRAAAPKKVRAVTSQNCWLFRGNDREYTGGDSMTISYSYTAVIETLIIVTNDYGNVLSEKVYTKTQPRTESVSSPAGCQNIDDFSERAFNQLQQFYDTLVPNQC